MTLGSILGVGLGGLVSCQIRLGGKWPEHCIMILEPHWGGGMILEDQEQGSPIPGLNDTTCGISGPDWL